MNFVWSLWFVIVVTRCVHSQNLDCKVPADIVILMDGSGSIKPDQWKQQTNFVRNLIGNFEIGPELIRIGLVVYSSYVSQTVDLIPFKTKQKLTSTELRHPRGGTNTASGITRIIKMFKEEGRNYAPHIMVLITDGKSMRPSRTISIAEQARMSGIMIFVVAVGQDVFMEELRAIVGPYGQDRLIDIKSFGSLQDTVERLRASVCKVIPPLTTTLAQTTTPPTTSSPGPGDVILLLGGCAECVDLDWQALLRFITMFVSNIDVSYTKIHIGVLVFSADVVNVVPLSPYKDKMTLIQMINRLRQPIYGKGEDRAISRMVQMFYQEGRAGVAKIGVFVSIGRGQHYTRSIMEKYRSNLRDIKLIGFGIDRPHLELSYLPAQVIPIRQCESTGDIDLSWTLIFNIYEAIRNYKPLPTLPTTSTTRGTITTTPATAYTTTASQTTTGSTPTKPDSCQVPGDIVILIDGSDSLTDEDWLHGIGFVTQLIDHLDIARDGNHIGEIVYSSEIGDMVRLSPYKPKPELKRLTRFLRQPKDGTNTALGIERTRQMIHEEGRPEAPDIAIVITDGRSKNGTATKVQSSLAKQEGITMVTVGVGAYDIADELTLMASRPSLYYPVGNYQALTGLLKTLKTMVCAVVTTIKPTTPSIFPTKPTGPVPSGLCDGCIIDKGIGYNPYPEDCTKYVQCFKEGAQFRAIIMPCPFGSFWDTKAITCRDSTTVDCPRGPCSGMAYGAVVPYLGMGCRAHWICYAGKAMARCCPEGQRFRAGWGCITDSSCQDVCPPESHGNKVVKCDLRRHPTDESKYIQITPGGEIERPCAPGSVFMESVCTCRMKQGPMPPPRECMPAVNYTFNGNLEDTSRDKSYSGMRNIGLTSYGTASFNGDSSINMWRFAGIDFGSDFAVKIRYKAGLSMGGQTQYPINPSGYLPSGGSGNLQISGQMRLPSGSLSMSKNPKGSLNTWRINPVPYRIQGSGRLSETASGSSTGAGVIRGTVRGVSLTPTAAGTRQTGTGYQSSGRIQLGGSLSGGTYNITGINTPLDGRYGGTAGTRTVLGGSRYNITRINTTLSGRYGDSPRSGTVSRQVLYGSSNPQISGGVRTSGIQTGGSLLAGGYNSTRRWKPTPGSVVFSNQTVTRTVQIGPKVVARRTSIGRPRVTFRRRIKRQAGYPQALLTNCGVGREGPSILILIYPNEITFKLKTSAVKEPASLTLPTTRDFNDVSLKYDGSILTANVNGQEASTRLTGTIERRQAGLLVGSCDGFNNFRGEMDYVYVWQCLPRM